MANWSRSEAIALLSLLVALISCVAGLAVVPEVRHFLGTPAKSEELVDNQPDQPASLSGASPTRNVQPVARPMPEPSSTRQTSPSPAANGEVGPITRAGLATEAATLEESESSGEAQEATTSASYSVTASDVGRPGSVIEIPAMRFSRGGNVEAGVLPYGDVIHNAAPYGSAPNWVEYDFSVASEGEYELWIEYAADESRPVDILLNGRTVLTNALAGATGGWHLRNQQFSRQCTIHLSGGLNTLRLERSNVFPHVRTLRLVPMQR